MSQRHRFGWKAVLACLVLIFTCFSGVSLAQTAAQLPFSEGFESGRLAGYWAAKSSMGRILVTKNYAPHSGAYHLTMDSYYRGYFASNELTLTVNLNGKSGVKLSFWHRKYYDYDNALPSKFVGSYKGDGVSISADGNTWYKLQGLTTADGATRTWKQFNCDVDAAAARVGIKYNGTFKIKFQQFDNYPIPTSGFCFDDIQIGSQVVNTDSDADGLPDDWELRYFGSLSEFPDGDFDGDGLTNLQEYQLGKDPTRSDAPAVNATFPFSEHFETDLGDTWTTRTVGSGRMLVTSANGPAAGSYQLTMDNSRSGVTGLNELILSVDLSGKTDVILSFQHKTFASEDDLLPNSFTGSIYGDGVSISADGITWYKVQGLTTAEGASTSWKKYDIDLDAAAAARGIGFNSAFKVKFQQSGTAPIPYGGAAFDEISLSGSAPTPPPPPPPQDDLLPQEREVIDLVNQQRAQNGLRPLVLSLALSEAARRHSVDMATHNFFSHTGSDGSSPWDRFSDAGYRMTAGGECVGAGYSTPAAAVQGWMNSSGHRAIILGSYCDVGVGYATGGSYGYYWTLDVGCQ